MYKNAVKSLVLFLVTLLGFAPLAQGQDQTLKIGEVRSLTGPANFYGIPQSRGMQLAISEINAAGGVKAGGKTYRLELVSQDDQASPTAGVAGLRKLMADDVRFIVGPVVSGVAAAIKPIIESSPNLTQLVDGATVDGITNGKNIFRHQADIFAFEAPMIALMKQRKYPTVALMTDRFHAGMMGTEQSFANALEKNGNKVVAREYHKINDTTFSAQLTKIIALAPSVVIMRGYATETALMVRQSRQLGYTGIIAWEGVAPPSAVTKNIGPAEMEGVFNSFPPTVQDLAQLGSEKAKRVVEGYRKMFNAEPGELTAISFDAVYILKAAIEKAGSIENAKVNEALATLRVSDVRDLVSNYDPREGGRFFDATGQAAMRGGAHTWRGAGWTPIPGI